MMVGIAVATMVTSIAAINIASIQAKRIQPRWLTCRCALSVIHLPFVIQQG